MLQNARVTAFTVSKLLRENQQGGSKLPPLPFTQLTINIFHMVFFHLVIGPGTNKNDEASSDFPLAETIAGIAVVLAILLVIFVALMVRRKR